MKKIFISYSHCDAKWKDLLVKHLNILELEEPFSVWEDCKIQSGQFWKVEIEKALKEADIAILMVSVDFLTSKFIIGQEVPFILERRQTAGLKLIPLIVKPCAWERISWLSDIQVFPKNGTPLSLHPKKKIDSILSELINEIGKDKHQQLATRNATSFVLNKINHASRKENKILDLSNSLKKWLLKDFYTEGAFAGQFGNVGAK
ncbi:MAG: toll/interleukin-1 receptor domain-containing protein, partial [Acidobacteria bacterium]|nr:toll/interleukin-1 receptor domain-containing protein [Acidobacteriota bacterium]